MLICRSYCGMGQRAYTRDISSSIHDQVSYYLHVRTLSLDWSVLDRVVPFTLEIRNNSQVDGLNVPDATKVPVCSTEDVLRLMDLGMRNRAVACTSLNERSSRSHRYGFCSLPFATCKP